ncbi:MAG: TetR/AcrR family transcriptional regulator [Ramlibacter sp.]|nr:TetR/AcrR family transcriptional regulator [Ramlibacter sp.]
MKRQAVQQIEADTRERIISAAVQVFAKSGFSAGTVREITEIAEVNIAAVNYHFGSKDGLAKHVLELGIASIIQVRTDSLRACVARHRPASPTVESICEALVVPLVELGSGRYRDVMTLLTHARADAPPFIIALVEEKFAPLHEEFVDVLQRVLPELSRTEIALRYDCARGAILQTLVTLAPALTLVSGTHGASAGNHEVTTRRLVSFVAGGLGAPPS